MSLQNKLSDDETVTELVGTLRGVPLRPDDDGYDEARSVWNGMVDRRPALIVQCTGTADSVAAVDFDRENDVFGLLEQLGELGETTPSKI